jgi:hypothetical protein
LTKARDFALHFAHALYCSRNKGAAATNKAAAATRDLSLSRRSPSPHVNMGTQHYAPRAAESVVEALRLREMRG